MLEGELTLLVRKAIYIMQYATARATFALLDCLREVLIQLLCRAVKGLEDESVIYMGLCGKAHTGPLHTGSR